MKRSPKKMQQPAVIPPLSDDYVILNVTSSDGQPKRIMIRRRLNAG